MSYPDEVPTTSTEEQSVSLAESGNVDKLGTTTIGDQEFEDLPLDTSLALRSQAQTVVSTDSQGIDRIVTKSLNDWEPAPVEPDPDEVARLEQAQEVLAAHREEHRNRLGLNQDKV